MKQLIFFVCWITSYFLFSNSSLAQSCNPQLDVIRKFDNVFGKIVRNNESTVSYTDPDGYTITETYADVTVEFYSDESLAIPKSVVDFPCKFGQILYFDWQTPFINYVPGLAAPLRNGTSFTEFGVLVEIQYSSGGGATYADVLFGDIACSGTRNTEADCLCLSNIGKLYLTNGNYQFVNNATWYRSGVIIPGVSLPTYNTSIVSTYYVTLPGGICGGTLTTPTFSYNIINSCAPPLPLNITMFKYTYVDNCMGKVSWVIEDAFEAKTAFLVGYNSEVKEKRRIKINRLIPIGELTFDYSSEVQLIRLELENIAGRRINSSFVRINNKECVNGIGKFRVLSLFGTKLVVESRDGQPKNCDVQVYNAEGKLLVKTTMNVSRKEISLSECRRGQLLIIKINGDSGMEAYKIIY